MVQQSTQVLGVSKVSWMVVASVLLGYTGFQAVALGGC